MRILIVSEDVPYASMGGLAKHALNLARALIKQGHTVDFLGGDQHPIDIAGAEGQFGGRFIGELAGHLAGWKEKRLGLFNPMRRTWVAKRFARTITKYARDYDVVHYHGHFPNLANYIAADVPFIQTRHDQGSECLTHTRFKNGDVCRAVDASACASCVTREPNFLQTAISGVAVRRFREETSAAFKKHPNLFVSDMLRRNFTRAQGEGPWGEVIHNFVDLEMIAAAKANPQRLPDAASLEVLVAGKLYPPKGIDVLVKHFSQRKLPDTRLLVIGDGPQLQALQREFEAANIRFLGWCDSPQTLRLTAGADAVVVPSVWEEPCATTIFEGLLLGKPCFALNRGGTPELAMYARTKEQLKLHDDIETLVDDLSTLNKSAIPDVVDASLLGGAEKIVLKLIPKYEALKCRSS